MFQGSSTTAQSQHNVAARHETARYENASDRQQTDEQKTGRTSAYQNLAFDSHL